MANMPINEVLYGVVRSVQGLKDAEFLDTKMSYSKTVIPTIVANTDKESPRWAERNPFKRIARLEIIEIEEEGLLACLYKEKPTIKHMSLDFDDRREVLDILSQLIGLHDEANELYESMQMLLGEQHANKITQTNRRNKPRQKAST